MINNREIQRRKRMANPKIDFYSPINLKSYNLDQTMRYQLNMLERLDPYTRRHSENVANLTCRVCEYLHCKQKFTIHATICAYLHDIGKLFIPKEILNKPDKLTPEEFDIMKNHTTLGYNLCMKDMKLKPYAMGPLYHHEALNGTGYPSGLTKKEIPYTAQIIRVADEYDALVTKRQYKTHIHISETLKELIKDTKPTVKSIALDQLSINSKLGKINPKVLKALCKVVIDDTLYEISCVYEYVDYLKSEINRLETIENYHQKMISAKKEKDVAYYKEGIQILLASGETMDNFQQVLEDYRKAHQIRLKVIEQLYNEIKIIKKLKY